MIKEFKDIEEKLITNRPELTKAEFLVEPFDPELPGIYDLFISYNNRSCRFHNVNSNSEAEFSFFWDGCKLFEIKNSLPIMSNVIYDWLISNIKPSELEKKYNWINTGKVAGYYEKGEGVKGEFIDSWDKIEAFYKQFLNEEWHRSGEDALKLIKEMRGVGLDEQLRAGQSLWHCFLSRSRRHGLTLNAPYLRITFLGNNKMVVRPYFGKGDSYFKDLENFNVDEPENFGFKGEDERFEFEVKYEREFEKLVKKLLKEKIE